nr:hypothetical protein [Tanacetum cinerariifolium]
MLCALERGTPISTVGPSRALNNGEPSYPDDPLMPHLEDIYASPSVGIFTDSSYDDEEGDSCSSLRSLAVKFKQMVDSGKASGADSTGISNVESDNINVHDHGNYGNGGMKPISFASILKEQTNKKTVKLYVLSNDEIVNGVDVAILLVAVSLNFI